MGVQYWNDYGILKQDSNDALAIFKGRQVKDELRRRAGVFKAMNGGNKGMKSSLSRLKSYNR